MVHDKFPERTIFREKCSGGGGADYYSAKTLTDPHVGPTLTLYDGRLVVSRLRV